MVEELLDFTRMQDGRFTLRVEETDLLAELEDAIFTYREIFSQEGIELRYECADDLPPIIADGERMKQVFCNVLDNAAKHGGSGKRIDVSVAAERRQHGHPRRAISAPASRRRSCPTSSRNSTRARPRRAAAASALPCATRSCVCTTARSTLPTPRAAARS